MVERMLTEIGRFEEVLVDFEEVDPRAAEGDEAQGGADDHGADEVPGGHAVAAKGDARGDAEL